MDTMRTFIMSELVPGLIAVAVTGSIIWLSFNQIEVPNGLDIAFGGIIVYFFGPTRTTSSG